MKEKLPEILIKILLGIFELLFVWWVINLRLEGIGWMLIFFSIGLLFWIVAHLIVMSAFIFAIKFHIVDILLYLAVHVLFLLGWLFQTDMGDSGIMYWTIQKVFDWPTLTPFLDQWGNTLFWNGLTGTLLCYLLILILVGVKFVKVIWTFLKKSARVQP